MFYRRILTKEIHRGVVAVINILSMLELAPLAIVEGRKKKWKIRRQGYKDAPKMVLVLFSTENNGW